MNRPFPNSVFDRPMNRRQMLRRFANGFGMLGLAGLLTDDFIGSVLAEGKASPLTLKPPQFPAKAKRVIFLFMSGGPSHVDTFDPKPRLAQDNGKPLPFEKPKLERTKTGNLLASPYTFEKRGQSGTEVSELFPHLATCVDDLCIIRSMVADNINHNGACLQMNTGEQAFSRPCMGSWLLYGLGSENQNLPGFVVISPSQPAQGAPLWSSSFLPAAYQGTLVSDLKNPIDNLRNSQFSLAKQREQLDVLGRLNEIHRRQRQDDSQLSARGCPGRRPAQGPESPRAFTRDARDLEWRVWPNSHRRGKGWPRASSLRLQHVAGRRWHQRRLDLWRHRRVRLARRRRQSP